MKKFIYFSLLIIGVMSGCVAMDNSPRHVKVPKYNYNSGEPQLSILLALRDNIVSDAKLNLTDLEILAGDKWLSLLDGQPLTVSAKKIGANQRFINRQVLPVGNYTRLRYTFEDRGRTAKGNGIDKLIKEQPLLPSLSLGKNDSLCLFLIWDVANTVGIDKIPVISAMVKPVPLTTELAFISCPDINTIYILRTDSNRICGSFGVSGRPTYLNVSKDDNELIALAPAQNKIKIIELSSGRLKDSINIPMMRKPIFMVVDSNRRYAYLLDGQSDYLSKIDLQTGLLLRRARVIERPEFLTLADDNTLLLSSKLAQKILFINTDNLQIIQTISDGGGAGGLLVDGEYLYIAESLANNVAKYNINTGEIERHQAGIGPNRILSYKDHIYISNRRANNVSILLPGQLGVTRTLGVGMSPSEMAVSSSRSWLYIATETGVSVLDTTSQRTGRAVNLMAKARDVAIIQ